MQSTNPANAITMSRERLTIQRWIETPTDLQMLFYSGDKDRWGGVQWILAPSDEKMWFVFPPIHSPLPFCDFESPKDCAKSPRQHGERGWRPWRHALMRSRAVGIDKRQTGSAFNRLLPLVIIFTAFYGSSGPPPAPAVIRDKASGV
jgi:hypothetical protein